MRFPGGRALCCALALLARAAFPQTIADDGRLGVGSVSGAESPGLQRLQIVIYNELVPETKLEPETAGDELPEGGRFISTTHRFAAAYGAHPAFDLGLVVPVMMDYAPETDRRTAGVGDPELSLVWRPLRASKRKIALSATFVAGGLASDEGYAPRGVQVLRRNGTVLPFGRGEWGARAGVSHTRSWFGKATPLLWHSQLEFAPGFGDAAHLLRAGTAVEKRLREGWALGTWAQYDRALDGAETGEDPHQLDVGGQVSFRTNRGFAAQGGVVGNVLPSPKAKIGSGGKTFSADAVGNPRLFVAFSMDVRIMTADSDGDGVPDYRDGCPQTPEDRDGFFDNDGCPDPDNDGDRLCDPWVGELDKGERYADVCAESDVCPNLAEDFDGFEDGDGCPDPDNDGDGVPDSTDSCPDLPEDFDGFEDGDGCPDLDNDRDGALDAADSCPDLPEDFDGFEDEDGCPDPDNDKDGVPDDDDGCPAEAETYNGYMDEDGCPDDEQIDEDKAIRDGELRGLRFAPGVAEWPMESFGVLDSLAAAMKRHRTAKIVVVMPRDAGAPAGAKGSTPESTARRRLDSILNYLIARGVDPLRLEGMVIEGRGDVAVRLR